MTWNTVTLGDVLTESAIPAEVYSPDRRITVRLNVKGVEKRPMSNDKEGATKYFVRKAGQFIYGRQNLHKGAFGIVPPELDGYESSQDLPAFDISEQCEPAWLIYFLRQGNFYESLDRLARGIGSRRINPKDLYTVEMPLPSLDDQRALLQTLTATDEAAEALIQDFTYQATLLTDLRQAVLREAVQGRLVSQEASDESAAALLSRISVEKQRLVKEKKLRAAKPLPPLNKTEVPYQVPQGWAWERLQTLCSHVVDCPHSTAKFVSEGYACIDTTCISPDTIHFDKLRRVSEDTFLKRTKTFKPQPGDIIFTREGTIGTSIIIPEGLEACMGQRVMAFRPFEGVTPAYLNYALRSSPFVEQWSKKLLGIAAKHINVADLRAMLIPLPPLSEQRRIVAKVTELLAHCTALEAELSRAQKAAEALHAAALHEAFMEPTAAMAKAEL